MKQRVKQEEEASGGEKEKEREREKSSSPNWTSFPLSYHYCFGCKVTQLCLLCLRKLQLSNLNRRYLVHSLLTRVVHLKNLSSPLLSYFQATRAHTNNLSSVDEESPTSHFPSKQFRSCFLSFFFSLLSFPKEKPTHPKSFLSISGPKSSLFFKFLAIFITLLNPTL